MPFGTAQEVRHSLAGTIDALVEAVKNYGRQAT